ncbi:hypothetical protein GCM10007198_28200 [Microbacterium aerolatum]|uniref:Uncharacterized protein n=1 Tax=Microbacterium aerolatum TaxID=153731 RepID=A0A511AG33_9MICO|nr:hypothetical protein MAE01_22810 [Microbacterium aerolatum]GGB36027.1 hypothetical protein GCM10007198_28200 [Microbacterium aerolatum]
MRADLLDPGRTRDYAGDDRLEHVVCERESCDGSRFDAVALLDRRDVIGCKVPDHAIEVEEYGSEHGSMISGSARDVRYTQVGSQLWMSQNSYGTLMPVQTG